MSSNSVIGSIEKVLSTIDGVIRRCRPPEPLCRQLAEEPLGSSGVSCAHHPDSPCVLCRCRQRHPSWPEFPVQTIRVSLYTILSERCTRIVLRRICQEESRTIVSVMERLAGRSPDGSEEDIWWVWYELARRSPDDSAYIYSDAQIDIAWRSVRRARRRLDNIGAGGPRRGARRQRREALQHLTAELARPAADLLHADIDDFNSHDHTLALRSRGCVALMKLSEQSAKSLDDWLQIRGQQPGYLFEMPCLPEFWERSLPTEDCAERANGDACLGSLLDEDCLQRLIEGGSELAYAFVLSNATDRGGDWSPAFIERLRQGAGALAGRALSKYERRKCRKMMSERVERLAREEVPASDGP